MKNKFCYLITMVCMSQFNMAQSTEHQQLNHSGTNWFSNMMEQTMEKGRKNSSNQHKPKIKKITAIQKPTKNKYKQIKGVTQCDILAAHPDDPDKSSSGVLFDQIKSKEAIRSCKLAIKKSPSKGRFYYQLGRALQKDGQMAQAMIAHQSAIDHSYMMAHYNLGDLMADLKQYKSAINHFTILANTGNGDAMFALTDIYYNNLKDKKSSDYWLRKAAENNQPDAIRILREERVNSLMRFFN